MEYNKITFSELNMPLRVSPRPLSLRQANYEDEFDYDTLIYDVLYRDNKIVILSPFLTEEQISSLLNNILIDGLNIKMFKYHIFKTNRTIKIIIFITDIKQINSIFIYKKEMKFLENRFLNYDTSRVLYTLQKNNDIEWIKDWIQYYNHIHKPSLVIIYDNNSDVYTVDELNRELKKIATNCIVLSFPFKYGPGAFNGSSWDSDYCQYAAFEHIRYSLPSNSLLLNVDIDEICISLREENNIYNYLLSSEFNAILFKGKWCYIEKDKNEIVDNKHCFHEIFEKDTVCSPKYVVNLDAIEDNIFLGVHDVIYEKNKLTTTDFIYLHCRNISNNWKYKRDNKVQFNENIHERNNYLSDCFISLKKNR